MDYVQNLFLFTELNATTGFEHAMFKMFDHQVPHIAWLAVVGIYSLLGIVAIIGISYLYGFHIFLSKYTSNTFILLSVGMVILPL